MASSPKDNQSKIETVRNAWKTLAPDKSFGGMTYAQFETATAPSFTTRQQLEENDDQRTQYWPRVEMPTRFHWTSFLWSLTECGPTQTSATTAA